MTTQYELAAREVKAVMDAHPDRTRVATPSYIVGDHFVALIPNVVIALRREGFTAYAEGRPNAIRTNAPRAIVNMAAGNGLFLTFTTGQSR